MMAAYNEILRQGASAQGLAAQEAESFGAKFKTLKEQIGETVGQLGSNLLPVLEPLVQKFSEVATKVSEWVNNNPQLTQTIFVVVGAIGAFLAILGPIIIGIGALTVAAAGFSAATLPVTAAIIGVVAAIAVLIAIGVVLWQNWDTLVSKAHEISDSITKAIDGFTQKCSEKLEQFKTSCKTKFDEIKNNISNIWNSIKSITSSVWDSIKSLISNVWNGIKSTVSSVCSSV